MNVNNYQLHVTKYDYEKNPRGIEVKKCCASCAHKLVEEKLMRSKKTEKWRMCEAYNQVCESHAVCDSWAMSDICKSVGQGEPGDVKCKEYLLWRLEELSRRKKEAVDKGFKPNTPAYKELVTKFEMNPQAYYNGEVYYKNF